MGKAKINIPMTAALVLLLLTMISIHLTSGLYARYTSTAEASDSARVAKFDVDCALVPVADKEGAFTLSVTNNSEVAVKYSIEVQLPEDLSATIGAVTLEPADGANSVTFMDENWTMAPNAENPNEHILQLDMTNWVGKTDRISDKGATEPVTFNFSVKVHAEQID